MIVLIQGKTINTGINTKTLTDGDAGSVTQRGFNDLVVGAVFAITLRLDVLFDVLVIIDVLLLVLSKFVVFAVLALGRFGSWSCLLSWSLDFNSESIAFIVFEFLQGFLGV